MATTRRHSDGGSQASGAVRSKVVSLGGGRLATAEHYPPVPNGDDEPCRSARCAGAGLHIDRLLARRQSLPELDAYKKAHEREQELTAEIQTGG